jgi:chemotaxis protein methyltransferase CheR
MKRGADLQADGLTQKHFERLATLIHRVAGIKMPPSKHSMMEGRLRKRVVASGAGSFDAYCEQVLQQGDDGPEIVHLIDAITTNKTDFFREPEHFRLLTEQILPGLARADRPLQLWSSACSIGAEPYTLAMVLSDFLQSQQGRLTAMPTPIIYATDICTTVLQTARLGIYPADMIEPVPMEFRRRYVLRAKSPADRTVRIAPALRRMVWFGQLNLMSPQYEMEHDLDVVFCRNVLIYFDRVTQAAVLRRLCDHLRPGGVLAVGHSEALHNLDLPLQPVGQTMFRKTDR